MQLYFFGVCFGVGVVDFFTGGGGFPFPIPAPFLTGLPLLTFSAILTSLTWPSSTSSNRANFN